MSNSASRTSQTTTLLRSLDPADPAVDPHSRQAQDTLARILHTPRHDAAGESPARGRTSSPRAVRTRRLVLSGGLVAVAAAVVLAVPAVTGGDRAFASWTATPDPLTSSQQAAAAEECRDAQADAAGTGLAGHLAAAEPVVSERRGEWTTVLLAGAGGFEALCVTDGSTRLFADWFGSIGIPATSPPGPREVTATDLGAGAIDAGRLSVAAGLVGSDVASVTYESPGHGPVRATVAGGHFALWLPGEDLADAARAGATVRVGYLDGTHAEVTLRLS